MFLFALHVPAREVFEGVERTVSGFIMHYVGTHRWSQFI